MKISIFFLVLLFLVSCGTGDDEEETNTFQVSVIQDANQIEIDQIVTLTASSNDDIQSVSYSLDGGSTFSGEYSTNFGNVANLYLDFDTPGNKQIVFRVRNSEGQVVDTALSIQVVRGAAVKLQNLQLNTFFNQTGTWDDEYPDTDSNRLADVFFVVLKPSLNVFTGIRSVASTNFKVCHTSSVRVNASNLSWNLENEALYVNLTELIPYIAFGDDDGGGIAQDIMLGPPFQRSIPLLDYVETSPASILVEENDISLEYELEVDWN